MRQFNTIEERLDYIEFRQQLLWENDSLSRFLFECEITEKEYSEIMDIMDELRNKIAQKSEVYSGEFERAIYKIVPSHKGDYHFCEDIAMLFMENGRWAEVFPALYGGSPKYSYLRGQN